MNLTAVQQVLLGLAIIQYIIWLWLIAATINNGNRLNTIELNEAYQIQRITHNANKLDVLEAQHKSLKRDN